MSARQESGAWRKLIESLTKVRAEFDQPADDTGIWRVLLLKALQEYLVARGAEKDLLVPLVRMRLDLADSHLEACRREAGLRGMPVSLRRALCSAAAATTVLKERGDPLRAAEEKVARAMGLERKRIHTFRQNILSRNQSDFVREAYRLGVAEMNELPEDALLRALAPSSAKHIS